MTSISLQARRRGVFTFLGGNRAPLSLGLAILFGSFFLVPAPLRANPTGANVVAGTATMATSGNTLNVTNSNGAVINWQSFSIASGERTNFFQVNASSSVLNRVVGTNISEIAGTLWSNGRVILVNQNGIQITPGSFINTAGFMASTLDVANNEFARFSSNPSVELHFMGDSTAKVENLGTIVSRHGDVFLIGRQVDNQGTIKTKTGTVGLYASDDVYLTSGGDDAGTVRLTSAGAPVAGTGVSNSGLIEAAKAELKATGNIYSLAINNTGTVRATGTVKQNGVVRLVSLGGLVQNSGTLAAKNRDGSGGTVKMQGGAGGTTIDTGLVDVSSTKAGKKGGLAELTGQVVAVMDGGVVNASGPAGGGTILIGGGFHGADPDVYDASATYLSADSSLKADATDSGDGGKVAVWANDETEFDGTISARGGPHGGNGGQVETSAHVLHALGTVDTRAVMGQKGNWLLDPGNLLIQDSSGASGFNWISTIGTGFSLGGGDTDSLLTNTSLAIALGLSDITLTAANTITWTGNFNYGGTLAGTGTLTLNAGGATNISATINNDNENSSPLTINVASGTGITLTGVSMNAGSPSYGYSQVNLNLSSNQGGGANSVGGIALNGSTLNTSGGAVNLLIGNTSGTVSTTGVAISSTSITTQGGNVTIGGGTTSAADVVSGNAANTAYFATSSGGDGIAITSSSIDATGGTITLAGKTSAASGTPYGINLASGSSLVADNVTMRTASGSNLNWVGAVTLAASTGALTANSGGNLGMSGSLTQTGGEGTSTANFLAAKAIHLSGAQITVSEAGKMNVGLLSNTANSGGVDGAISISNSNISTNGGTIAIGGGTSNVNNVINDSGNTPVYYASSNSGPGVLIVGSTLDAQDSERNAGGSIYIEGKSTATSQANGIVFDHDTTVNTDGGAMVRVAGFGLGSGQDVLFTRSGSSGADPVINVDQNGGYGSSVRIVADKIAFSNLSQADPHVFQALKGQSDTITIAPRSQNRAIYLGDSPTEAVGQLWANKGADGFDTQIIGRTDGTGVVTVGTGNDGEGHLGNYVDTNTAVFGGSFVINDDIHVGGSVDGGITLYIQANTGSITQAAGKVIDAQNKDGSTDYYAKLAIVTGATGGVGTLAHALNIRNFAGGYPDYGALAIYAGSGGVYLQHTELSNGHFGMGGNVNIGQFGVQNPDPDVNGDAAGNLSGITVLGGHLSISETGGTLTVDNRIKVTGSSGIDLDAGNHSVVVNYLGDSSLPTIDGDSGDISIAGSGELQIGHQGGDFTVPTITGTGNLTFKTSSASSGSNFTLYSTDTTPGSGASGAWVTDGKTGDLAGVNGSFASVIFQAGAGGTTKIVGNHVLDQQVYDYNWQQGEGGPTVTPDNPLGIAFKGTNVEVASGATVNVTRGDLVLLQASNTVTIDAGATVAAAGNNTFNVAGTSVSKLAVVANQFVNNGTITSQISDSPDGVYAVYLPSASTSNTLGNTVSSATVVNGVAYSSTSLQGTLVNTVYYASGGTPVTTVTTAEATLPVVIIKVNPTAPPAPTPPTQTPAAGSDPDSGGTVTNDGKGTSDNKKNSVLQTTTTPTTTNTASGPETVVGAGATGAINAGGFTPNIPPPPSLGNSLTPVVKTQLQQALTSP